MDAREYFQSTVVPNYNSFVQSPANFHLLANTILSMNASAEYLGLDRRGYDPDVSGNQRRRDVRKIRDDLRLADLEVCADALKHVRKGDGVTLSSTGIDTNSPTSWKIGDHDLVEVAHQAFAALQKEFQNVS
jgi:hypothetical protein